VDAARTASPAVRFENEFPVKKKATRKTK